MAPELLDQCLVIPLGARLDIIHSVANPIADGTLVTDQAFWFGQVVEQQ